MFYFVKRWRLSAEAYFYFINTCIMLGKTHTHTHTFLFFFLYKVFFNTLRIYLRSFKSNHSIIFLENGILPVVSNNIDACNNILI